MRDRDAYHRQLFQTFIITMTGFFVMVLLLFQAILPIGRGDAWPLLDLPVAATGDKAPATEGDVWVSVRANGEIFVNETKVSAVVFPSDPARRVFVRADRATPFGAVRTLVRAAQRSGRRKLIFTAVPANADQIRHFFPPPCNDADVQPPVVERRVMPELPRRLRVASTAILDVCVDREGAVRAVYIIRGIDPKVDAEVVKAVRQWTFRPATMYGDPVACMQTVRVSIDVR